MIEHSLKNTLVFRDFLNMTQASVNADIATNSRKKLLKAGDFHLVHWLVISLSILVTLGAWYFSKDQLNQKVEAKFNREADQVVELIKERLELYENALWGGVALIDSNKGKMSYPQWLAYANSLKIDRTYPGINGIGVIYNIQAEEMNTYLKNERRFRPDYKLHPQHNEKEFWPITLIEPAATNKMAIGLDMAFETNRYTGIKKARDTGKAQLTGPITLVQDSKKTPGFLFYTPFYENDSSTATLSDRRKNIKGVTYAPFIMSKLMQGTLSTKNRHVDIEITDNGELLFEDNKKRNEYDNNPMFKASVNIELYGRKWLFNMQSDKQFRAASSNNQPTLILIGGIIIDSMLLCVFLLLTRANRKALFYADQTTLELQLKTKHLEKSNHDLEQFSYIASHDLKSPLNGIKQLATWIEEDCGEILPAESKEHLVLLKTRSERMMKLLNDLLEYSRINRKDFSPEIVHLQAMSEDIFALLNAPDKFTISAPDIEIKIPKPPFEIILRNLISNSIKHHDKDSGKIEINYECTDSMHVIRVLDNGPGIPEDLHDKAMQMFQTLQPRDRVEGSGMGLALAKRIVLHHGGSIYISKDLKPGAEFIIQWPI